MEGPSERLVVVVDGRVHEIPAYRSAPGPELAGARRWRGALLLLGGLLLGLGGFVGANLGAEAAVGGVMLFLATAVVAGTERYELATALGVSGVVWTSAGMSVALGADPSLTGSLAGFVIVGLVAVGTAALGPFRPPAPQPSG